MDEVNVDASVARLDRLIRPRFASVPLDQSDTIALLIHAEVLARAYQRLMDDRFGGALGPSPIAAAVLALVARAEDRGEEEWTSTTPP